VSERPHSEGLKRRRRRWRAAAAALAAGLALSVLAVRGRYGSLPALPGKTVAHLATGRAMPRFEALPGRTHVACRSLLPPYAIQVVEAPTGRAVRYASQFSPDPASYIPADRDGTSWVVLDLGRGPRTPHFSPVVLWSSADGSERLLGQRVSRGVAAGAYSHRSGQVALVSGDEMAPELLLIRLAGGTAVRLGPFPGPPVTRDPPTYGRPELLWSPDGQRLLAIFGYRLACIWDTQGTRTHQLVLPTHPRLAVLNAVWLGNEALLWAGGGGPLGPPPILARTQIATGRTTLLPTRDGADGPWTVRAQGRAFSWPGRVEDASPDGRWFVATATAPPPPGIVAAVLDWAVGTLGRCAVTRRAADWVAARRDTRPTCLIVADRDGQPRWVLPQQGEFAMDAAFLADGRVCWLEGDEVRVGDPDTGRR